MATATMSAVHRIEQAVRQLSPEELAVFRQWFAKYDAEAWDREIETDAAAGKFDSLVGGALRDLRAGRRTDLAEGCADGETGMSGREDAPARRARHVLFVCGRNRRRSPTAEHVFAGWPGVEVSSAGISPDADNPVTPELLEWADLIFVMERTHRAKLSTRFGPCLRGRKVVCLGIPDKYEFMDPALVQRLRERVPTHLPPRNAPT